MYCILFIYQTYQNTREISEPERLQTRPCLSFTSRVDVRVRLSVLSRNHSQGISQQTGKVYI